MNKKRFFFKFLAFLLIVSFGYIQSIEAAHPSHSSVTYNNEQVNIKEVSCSICFFIQHTQLQGFCTLDSNTAVKYTPSELDADYHYLSNYFYISPNKKKSRSPPNL